MSAHAHHDDHGHAPAKATVGDKKFNYSYHGKPIHPTGFENLPELQKFALTCKPPLKLIDEHGTIKEAQAVKENPAEKAHDHGHENHGEKH